MSKGFFITLEGGEGSGKTTLMKKLAEALRGQGRKVVTTREPGGSLLSEQIRHWLLNNEGAVPVGDRAELMLFLAARAQHVEELIDPALERGEVVICDRFSDSSIAYQGGGRGFGLQKVEDLCRFVCGDVWPHMTILLDIDPQKGLGRSTTSDRMESEELTFHHQVREYFRQLAVQHPQRYVTIDASLSIEEVYTKALQAVKDRI
ncbi:MAG: dTMP kinase [Chlamydiota bacterium]